MGILFDNSASLGNTTGTSLTTAYTVSGTNPVLHVGVATPTADNTDYITSVTYNGVTMSRVDTFHSPGQGGVYMYELVNPAVGTHDVVISASGSVPIYGVAHSLKSSLQTGQPDTSGGTAADPTTSVTQNVTTTTNRCWLVSVAGRKTGSSDTIAAGTNTTARTVNDFIAIGDSNGPQNTAGSHGQTWTLSGSNGLGVCVVAVKPLPNDDTGFFAVL